MMAHPPRDKVVVILLSCSWSVLVLGGMWGRKRTDGKAKAGELPPATLEKWMTVVANKRDSVSSTDLLDRNKNPVEEPASRTIPKKTRH